MTIKTIKLSSGYPLAVRESGNGTPIVLLHGWGVSGALFEAQIEGLSEHYRVIVPDLPGHGASVQFPAGAGFALLADSIYELIQQLELKQTILVGWSMGAMVCWDLLLRYPRLDIAGLVTIDMVPHLLNTPNWPHGLEDATGMHTFEAQVKAMQSDWPVYTQQFEQALFSPESEMATQYQLEKACKIALANDPLILARIWMAMAEQDFRQQVRQISIPTLIIAGAHSQLYRIEASEWLAAQIPNASLITFSSSGHSPHIEEPQHFNRVLSAFIEQARAPYIYTARAQH